MQKSVIEYLSKTVSLYPDKLAVKDMNQGVTFKVLWDNSCIIASEIIDFGLKNAPICVFAPKGCLMVEAFAAINMSGNFYVPLDTKSPGSRIRSILSVLDVSLVVTDRAHYDVLTELFDKQIIVIEDVLENCNPGCFCDFDLSRQIDTDPVYSIFTSGSTGTPKGVVISHRGVIDYIDWAVETFQVDNNAVIGNQAPFYFDNSTLDIYLMYATGATLCVIPEEMFIFPAKLIDYLNENKITFVFWVPFVLINVANMNILASKKPKCLKDVLFAGEVMPNKHLNYWRKHLPECRYANLYGPTEITVDCTCYIVDREFSDNESLPIGKQCRNSDVMVLVDREREASVNEQGELCVRGSSLALGYYNDWEKTKKSFIQNPLNTHYPELIYCTGDIVYRNELDEIIYVGRKDSQIKHNGYRIELGEIENAIIASEIVDNCCVVYDFLNKKIVLFYQSACDMNMGEFRKSVSARLPRYMLPSEYHREDVLRQNGSGKIDRSYYNIKVNG